MCLESDKLEMFKKVLVNKLVVEQDQLRVKVDTTDFNMFRKLINQETWCCISGLVMSGMLGGLGELIDLRSESSVSLRTWQRRWWTM